MIREEGGMKRGRETRGLKKEERIGSDEVEERGKKTRQKVVE
jgi:hypothetical protein